MPRKRNSVRDILTRCIAYVHFAKVLNTDMTGNGPGHSAEEGARPAVALATMHASGHSAGFFACSASGELVQKNW